ncbi:unnamed protein product, partial [Closterium sp. Yama58-4]
MSASLLAANLAPCCILIILLGTANPDACDPCDACRLSEPFRNPAAQCLLSPFLGACAKFGSARATGSDGNTRRVRASANETKQVQQIKASRFRSPWLRQGRAMAYVFRFERATAILPLCSTHALSPASARQPFTMAMADAEATPSDGKGGQDASPAVVLESNGRKAGLAKGQRKPPHRRERYFVDGSKAAKTKDEKRGKARNAAQGLGCNAAEGLGGTTEGFGLTGREPGGGEAETDWSAWGKDSADDEGRGKGEERREEGMVEEGEVEDDEEGEDGVDAETRGRMGKYSRGKALKTEVRRLKAKMEHREKVIGQGVLTAAQAEKWLLPSEAGYVEAEGVERTSNLSQADIVQHVGAASRRAAFHLKLPELGPYKAAYSLNGRSLLLGGRKGHVAVVDWRRCHVTTEIQVRETVHDVCFLHNELFFAAAQKRYTFIYDKRGMELHCLK